jgi:NAD(P)-dependent dehydrogenase (short-subunit alcohol dehydrogenase family)
MEHSTIDNGVMVDQKSVIMITGGARGITAEAAHVLAKHKPTLILVGRSPLPPAEEPEATAQCTSPAELKKRLIDRMRQESSGRATPSAVESAYRTLLHEREIRGNLASLRQAGATVEYLQADVRDEDQVRKIVEGVYKTHGRLDGVIHGAGIIEDKLIEEKTPESFDRVFDTKVDSAIILSRVLRPESLKFFVLFSSVSGAFGNRGQVDYSAANAAMDCIAASLDQRWPGHVVSINWGPWDKVGMVSDLVRAQMTQRGVQLIAGAAGVHALEQEIQRGKKGEVQVVLGGGPWDVPESLPSKQLSSFPQAATAVPAAILATA